MPQNRKIRMPSVGDIVRSKQGRDRFRVFLVIDIDEENKLAPVVVADGKLHKTGDKKHKNPRHLAIVGHDEIIDKTGSIELISDVQVYEICEKHDICRKK